MKTPITISGGNMWQSLEKSHKLLLLIRPILIIPALCGAFICYTVFWMPVDLFQSYIVFTAILILLTFLAIKQSITLFRLLSSSVFDIEEFFRVAGLLFAIAVGFLWVLPRIQITTSVEEAHETQQNETK